MLTRILFDPFVILNCLALGFTAVYIIWIFLSDSSCEAPGFNFWGFNFWGFNFAGFNIGGFNIRGFYLPSLTLPSSGALILGARRNELPPSQVGSMGEALENNKALENYKDRDDTQGGFARNGSIATLNNIGGMAFEKKTPFDVGMIISHRK